MKNKIVLLCADGDSTRTIASALEREFGSIEIIVEEPVSKIAMLRRRAKKIGLLTVVGQAAFAALVMPLLRFSGRKRIQEIEERHPFEKHSMREALYVESVNSTSTQDALRRACPDVVVVSGTRIIGANTIASVNVPFINMHAGITPLYRGVHGGYWALTEGRPDLVGTTVHLVDTGIDTGDVIDQSFFEIGSKDNFATYPHLHTAAGLPILIDAVRKTLAGGPISRPPATGLASKLRYHPTVWGYVTARIRRGVR